KPLYYTMHGNSIAFASELQALTEIPWVDSRTDEDAVADYLRYLCIPAPRTIFKGVKKLEAGTFLHWQNGTAKIECYWDLREITQRCLAMPLKGSFREIADEFEALLTDSVGLRMRSDVPYGAFLSGGIDSALVVAMMRKQSTAPLHTFTI